MKLEKKLYEIVNDFTVIFSWVRPKYIIFNWLNITIDKAQTKQ